MMNVASDRPPRAHGIQCGIARMSIVASTGSPSSSRSSSVFRARTEWSYRMLWLTWRATPAPSHASTSARASSSDGASGFCARMPRTLLGWSTIRRITPGCSAGGTATSTTSTAGSSSIVSSESIDAGHAAESGDLLGRGAGARGQADDEEPGLGVGDEVAVADDEARPHDADPHVAAGWRGGHVAEVRDVVGRHRGASGRVPIVSSGPYRTGPVSRVQGGGAQAATGGSSRGQGSNQRRNSASVAPRDTATAARPTARVGARTAMTRTPRRHRASQAVGETNAARASTVRRDQDDVRLARLQRGPGQDASTAPRPRGRG